MRVLNVLTEREIGGAQLHVLQVASILNQEGVESIVAIPSGSGGIAPLLQEQGVPFYEIPGLCRIRQSINPWTHFYWAMSYWPCVVQLVRIIRKEKIDIVHQHGILHTQGAIAARLAGAKLVWHLHGMVSPRLSYLLRPLVPVLAHTIVVNSQQTATAYFDKASPDLLKRVKVVYPPVDIDRFGSSHSVALRNELGVPDSALLIGMVGNINPLKGHLDFIRAASLVLKSIPDCHFVVVGRQLATRTGYYNQVVREVERVDLAGRIHFLGFRGDIPAVLDSLDIFVNPSHSEGFGMTVSEAMAAAKPIVATAVGGAREMLPDSSYGLVVESHQPEALANAVLYLARNSGKAREMAAQAAARVAEKFNLTECTRQHQQVYEDTMNLGAKTATGAGA